MIMINNEEIGNESSSPPSSSLCFRLFGSGSDIDNRILFGIKAAAPTLGDQEFAERSAKDRPRTRELEEAQGKMNLTPRVKAGFEPAGGRGPRRAAR